MLPLPKNMFFNLLNKNKSFSSVFRDHRGKVSDKWSSYLPIYEKVFEPFQNKKISILEIGIQNGGSLEIYSKYFIRADKIIGCDINQQCSLLSFDKNIEVIIGDCNDINIKNSIIDKNRNYQFIIDDGSHKSGDIINTFINYFEYLDCGGTYIIEDLHCSYWKDWQGSLYGHNTAISFLKLLVDVVNFEHWGVSKTRVDFINERFPRLLEPSFESILSTINGIQFYNSMCLIHKSLPSFNSIEPRYVVGIQADVSQGGTGLHGSGRHISDESGNPDSNINLFKRKNC